MGFNIAHISKYVRWLRKERENYRDACLVSKELAKIEHGVTLGVLSFNGGC